MIGVCIYKANRGLGQCEGPVSRLTVANKRSLTWKGLSELAERLKDEGEEPGVCKAHEARAASNGYLVALDEAPVKPSTPGARKVRAPSKPPAPSSGAASG
ncbi:MAG: hypothetical protein ACE147_18965 [Candidatus Methylomirabilales bacterium]